ncbi:hypothetical protein [Pseudomonas piscis]
MKSHPALPKVEVIRVGKRLKVDWDYQEAPESNVLHRRNDQLTTFIDGVLVGMGIPEKQVSCASGRTGTVNNLDEDTASRLATILSDLLHPLVSNEHKRLFAQAKLPAHLRNALRD